MITRRTISLLGLWVLCLCVPVSYSDGRSFEGRRLNPQDYPAEQSSLNSFPMVYIRTLVGGEPEILRPIAGAGLLLTGICVISLAFDFAPKKDHVSVEEKPGMPAEVASEAVLLVVEATSPNGEAFSEKTDE